MTKRDAFEAIDLSKLHNEIVTLKPETLEEYCSVTSALDEQKDDYSENEGKVEFWGETWKVCVVKPWQ